MFGRILAECIAYGGIVIIVGGGGFLAIKYGLLALTCGILSRDKGK